MIQYTNILRGKGGLLVREIHNGRRVNKRVKYTPHLYVPDKNGPYQDFYGQKNLQRIVFDTMYEMKEYLDSYKDMEGEVWGNSNPIYQYIYETYKDNPVISDVFYALIDIEVLSKQKIGDEWVDGGFPVAAEAKFPISAITQWNSTDKKYHTFSTAEWSITDSILYYKREVIFTFCKSERELLDKWLRFWKNNTPDIISGWNIQLFDIPYIVNRIQFVLGEEKVKSLSPWDEVESVESKNSFGATDTLYKIHGVSILDYIDLYKKHRYKPRESYKLSFISNAELDERDAKLEYTGTLNNLYYDNPIYFNDYNINDVHCIVKFEEKFQFISVVVLLSYYAGVNFEDSFSPIKIIDTMIYKECENNKIAIPLQDRPHAKEAYEGAFNLEPSPGLKKCIVSFDYTSLYPSIMRQWSISKDTHVSGQDKIDIMEDIKKLCSTDVRLSKGLLVENIVDWYAENDIPEPLSDYLKRNNITMTANCEFFQVDKDAIFSTILSRLFKERKENKAKSAEYKHKAQEIKKILKERGVNV